MANFNKVKTSTHIPSYEGGDVFEKTPINEWLNFICSSYLEDTFYESNKIQEKRFLELTDKMAAEYGYEFIAKAAFFARNELGMRSVSQLIAAWLNDKKFDQKRAFYANYMHRPDDVAEIFAAIDHLKGKRSHALVRGAADYLKTLSESTLAKYKLSARMYNMYDLINLTHATSLAINAYKKNILTAADTWENKIATAKNDEDRQVEWKRLVEEHKLGYMALIRNLNNILNISNINEEWINTILVPQITNEHNIKNSLIFPYRFYTAYRNLKVKNTAVIAALEEAFRIAAVYNAPHLENSGILLDVSGSMQDSISDKSHITIKEVGACFAIALYIANQDCVIVKFGNRAKTCNFNRLDNPFNLIDQLCQNEYCGYGTQIIPALKELADNGTFARIFIISDMQVMDNSSFYSKNAISVYHKYFYNTPVYSFDLGNYHTQILDSKYDHIHYITALNDQIFKIIGLLESNIDLFKYINSFNYY